MYARGQLPVVYTSNTPPQLQVVVNNGTFKNGIRSQSTSTTPFLSPPTPCPLSSEPPPISSNYCRPLSFKRPLSTSGSSFRDLITCSLSKSRRNLSSRRSRQLLPRLVQLFGSSATFSILYDYIWLSVTTRAQGWSAKIDTWSQGVKPFGGGRS